PENTQLHSFLLQSEPCETANLCKRSGKQGQANSGLKSALCYWALSTSVRRAIQQVEDESGFLEEIAMQRFAAIGVLTVFGALTIPITAQQKAAALPFEIRALSTRPELVSGGDVLLQV